MSGSTVIFPLNSGNVSRRFADALRRTWNGPSAVKRAAGAAGISPRTFERYWRAEVEPRTSDLVRMLAASAELEAEFTEMISEYRRKTGA